MNISPISATQNIYKNNANKHNPNFGVKLVVEDRVPHFFMKEAGNMAHLFNINPEIAMLETFNHLVANMAKLLKKLEPVKPLDMPVFLYLTKAAEEYADVKHIDGIGFPPTENNIELSTPSPMGRIVAPMLVGPDEASMDRIEEVITEMAEQMRPYYIK